MNNESEFWKEIGNNLVLCLLDGAQIVADGEFFIRHEDENLLKNFRPAYRVRSKKKDFGGYAYYESKFSVDPYPLFEELTRYQVDCGEVQDADLYIGNTGELVLVQSSDDYGIIEDLFRDADLWTHNFFDLDFDEHWISCSDCGKYCLTHPQSWSWKPKYCIPDSGGEVWCKKCSQERAKEIIDEYLELGAIRTRYAREGARKIVKVFPDQVIDPSGHGWVEIDHTFRHYSYSNDRGDDPLEVVKVLGKMHVLVTTLNAQFGCDFFIWVRKRNRKRAVELLEKAGYL